MNCCQHRSTTACAPARRITRIAGWVVPGAVLALMPKCPICFAAYLAMATGIGLSATMATWLRSGVILLCVGMLCVLTFRLVRRIAAALRATSEGNLS